eukprot:UN32764
MLSYQSRCALWIDASYSDALGTKPGYSSNISPSWPVGDELTQASGDSSWTCYKRVEGITYTDVGDGKCYGKDINDSYNGVPPYFHRENYSDVTCKDFCTNNADCIAYSFVPTANNLCAIYLDLDEKYEPIDPIAGWTYVSG